MGVTPKDTTDTTHQLGGFLMSLATTTLRRGRRLAVASLVAAAALSLTACQNGDDKAAPAPSASSSQAAPDGGSKAGDSTSGGSTSGGSASGGAAASGGASAGSSSAGGQQAGGGSGAAPGKGASRTGTNGGQGSATGGSGGQGGSSAGRQGVSGTWVGTLKWLTDYKLTVAPKSGMEQAFHLLDSTKVLGAAALCGDPDGRVQLDGSGYGTRPCTLTDLRKAAKLGNVTVQVTVDHGAATKIAELYHP
ncbi:hypothetical protein GTW98_20090 [Streptomyces sp. SID8375]|uniref:hypothetical protein n=1 Tax=unclassified Streptomyces TaxID=2593676 RepID=UPI0003707253|nr:MULTISPECIES: hypothetical protein [unclassified Streptomyces]MYX09075.1 hypothetical protein [Streptomyces sp. SID8375]